MKSLLRRAGIALMLTLAACTTDVNPVDVTPTAVASSDVALYRAVQEPDGSWTFDVDVPPNRCGVPAGIFTVNVTGLYGGMEELKSWHVSNGTYDVIKSVVITWTKNSTFAVPEKVVTTWTVKVLPDGPTVTWIATWTRQPKGATTISRIKCG